MGHRQTIEGLIATVVARAPDSDAIGSPDEGFISFRDLRSQIVAVGKTLRALGVGRSDVVAVALPDGPELASLFLGIAAAAVCAPLNPAFKLSEFEFYLGDLQPALLVVPDNGGDIAEIAAKGHGIPVAQFSRASRAGEFRHDGSQTKAASADSLESDPDDVALILHTSGTTARPKMVALSQLNLSASARNVAQSLQLGPADRCLNVMPLFHIHGLVAAVLASIAAGGSVVCTPGFDATRFHSWIDRVQPTWYTAVPTMHQAILARAESLPAADRSWPSLRMIRSSSSPLPPVVMGRLEATFGVPVLEAYGMTEAAHQIASNLLPPARRKPGSVGLPAGPEIAILDINGVPVEADTEGEVAIRGENVFPGYLGLEQSNHQGGWFRTGDLGRLDRDGYLHLSGRIKEIINRGGETIAPREIDEVLLTHPAVHQAVAFAVPDLRLGEQVAAAVVLKPGTTASEVELRKYVAARLNPAKVPRRILLLNEIPRGATGKLVRIGLADKLGLADLDGAAIQPGEYAAPRTAVEGLLVQLWQEVLDRDQIGVFDRFLDVGGDSLLAVRLLARLRESFGLEPSMVDFFDRPTISGQSELLEDLLLTSHDR